jgi:hypothetical protein
MAKTKKYYILMADIIKSSQKKGAPLMHEFSEIVDSVKQRRQDDFLSPPTITLGDEFQSVIKDLAAAVQVMLAIEEEIIIKRKSFKLRYVLHYGEIETPINPEIAWGMLGTGLATARNLLEELKGRRAERFFLLTEDAEKDAVLNKIFFLYSAVIDDWKTKDAETLSLFLQYPDYKVVAEKLQKDRSLLWRKEKTLRLREYNTAKALVTLLGK